MTDAITGPGLLIKHFQEYRRARLALLDILGYPHSNRDPLAEFSERLVASLLGGRLAESRVEKGYDVVTPEGRRVQVKYLANPDGTWVNEHTVKFTADMDAYAVVFFANLRPATVLIFQRKGCVAVAAALSKHHPAQETTLQLTQRNYEQILRQCDRFAALGVDVFNF
jgi:hypothetical protein